MCHKRVCDVTVPKVNSNLCWSCCFINYGTDNLHANVDNCQMLAEPYDKQM